MTCPSGSACCAVTDAWSNVPKEYAGRWHYDYDEGRRMFVVLASNRSTIAETEESEVADAICKAHNASLSRRSQPCPWVQATRDMETACQGLRRLP